MNNLNIFKELSSYINPYVLVIASFLIIQLLFFTLGRNFFSIEKWQKKSVFVHPNLYVVILFLSLPFLGVNKIFKNINSNQKNVSQEVSNCGPGDASCQSNVESHINGIDGVEVNFISYIQNNDGTPSGKFRVGILKQDERGINQFSATISTDCNCNVIDAGGIMSH